MTNIVYPAWTLEIDGVEDFAFMENTLNAEDCDKIIKYAKERGLNDATVGGGNLSAVRKSKVTWIEPTADMNAVYARLTDVVLHLNDKFFNFDLFSFFYDTF